MAGITTALADAINAPYHQPSAKLYVDWDGDGVYTDETTYVISMDGVESLDQITGAIAQPAECNILLDNATRRFDPTNTSSPLYSLLSGGLLDARAKIELGYNGERRQMGVFFITDLRPILRDKTATLRLVETISRTFDLPVTYQPDGNAPLRDVFLSYGSAVGLSGTAEITASATMATAVYAASVNARLYDELSQLAVAEGGFIFADEDGVLTFRNNAAQSTALRLPSIVLTRSEVAFDQIVGRKRDAANRVVLEYEDRNAAAVDEDVWKIEGTPLKVPAAETVTGASVGTYYTPGTLTLQLQPLDRVRWVDNFPVVWNTTPTLATANAAEDGSGSAIAMAAGTPASRLSLDGTCYYTISVGTAENAAVITFENFAKDSGGTAIASFVRGFTLQGKPYRDVSPYAVVANDTESQATYGQVIETRLRNAYLPTTDLVIDRAKDVLFFLSGLGPRVEGDFPGLPLKAGEVFQYADDITSQTFLARVLTLSWRFDTNGYFCNLTTAPAYPAPTTAFVGDIVPAPSESVVFNNFTPPFVWQPAGVGQSGLNWGEGTWD